MKKILLILMAVIIVTVVIFAQGSNTPTLYMLNWGDYINQDLIEQFEEENNVKVVMDEVDSNEAMYERILSNTTSYDIAVPSDYMVDKLRSNQMLLPIDKPTTSYFDVVDDVTQDLGLTYYGTPYFFGSLGIMYNKEYKSEVEEHGWAVFFEDILPEARIGMYDSARDALAVALLYMRYSVNNTDDDTLREAGELLKSKEYTIWGTDNLKTEVVAGNLDIALVYSGDYFDQLSQVLEEDVEATFDYYAPEENNLWVDYLVIPYTSKQPELAQKFVDFMQVTENAQENVKYVGYAPPIQAVYSALRSDEEFSDIIQKRSFLIDLVSSNFKGETYRDLGNEYSEKIEEIVNDVKQN